MEAEDLEARVAALERLVAALSEYREAAAGGDLGGRLAALKTRVAVQEQRMEKGLTGVSERVDGETGGEAPMELGEPEETHSADPQPDTDTEVCKGTGGPTGREDKSVDYAAGVENVLTLHGFDKPSALVYEGPDPDSDDDPIQFAGRVPKGGDISAGGELKWFTLRPKPRVDTDETGEITTPGQSIDKATAAHSSGKTTKDLQLRQFANVADTQTVLAADATGSGYKPADVHVLMRLAKSGERPKLVYVVASTGPFFVKGGQAAQNYAESIKIGDPTNGYVTLSVEAASSS
ncbi:MAG: hypothetical protein IJL06_07460 [Kiritimatiellae bacterium]|nr:hypothetical protein [Kiritimatiellia bacterium]